MTADAGSVMHSGGARGINDSALTAVSWHSIADNYSRMSQRASSRFVLPFAGLWLAALATVAASCRSDPAASRPPIVQPGAPGQAGRSIPADEAVDLSHVGFTTADARFMQGMIGHHAQALEMTALVPARTRREDLRTLALRIEVSQADEIKMMQRWLEVRGQQVPSLHAMHMHGATLMPGMLTPEQMAALANAKGAEFDRLFLEGMIQHHGGAITMVHDLFATAGAGQEADIFGFASEVDIDQRAEIDRMRGMLATH
jgi:uncharacterized protein (DUF305 family)